MSDILILDHDTANRIAAGEVVERPASVIKELVENAIDAGATAITVEAREAGVKYMRVTDNGRGIRAEEVRTAFERHATSKLRAGDPLTDIRTMGFRGEALPSIAAVARVEMRTRQAGALSGVSIRLEGGAVSDIRDAGCPEGTTLIVEDLFFNTPARLKFLKRTQTEAAALLETVAQLAMSHPDIAFRMILNSRQLYHTPGNGDLRRVAALTGGAGAPEALLDVCGIGAIGVRGLLGVGDSARPSRAGETFFVNGRVVRNRQLCAWVEEGCREYVMVGRYPYCALFIDMPAGGVDVNVHPNKLEVRFADEQAVRDAVINAVRSAIARRDAEQSEPFTARLHDPVSPLPAMRSLTPREDAGPPLTVPTERAAMREGYAAGYGINPPPSAQPITADAPSATSDASPAQMTQIAIERDGERHKDDKGYTVIGQLFGLYLMINDGDALYIVDQHAAHERILYDNLMSAGRNLPSQLLLAPFLMELSAREMALVEEHAPLLSELGYELAPFGAATLRVSAAPMLLGEATGKLLLQDIIGMLDAQRRVTATELMRERLISAACKRAVKDGDTLDSAQIEYILDKALAEGAPLTCPHGRPILIKMSRTELERLFKR